MKFSFTSLITRFGLTGLVMALGLFSNAASAQTWCSANAAYGCYVPYGGWVTSVTFKDASGKVLYSGADGCTGSAVMNSGNPFDITAGEQITVEVTGEKDQYGYGWGAYIGVWLDADRDGSFSSAECMVNPNVWGVVSTTAAKRTFTVPCTNNPGKSRIRVRGGASIYGMFTAGQGCGQIFHYGDVEDYEINLKLGTPPVADFSIPTGPNYLNTPVGYLAKNPSSAYTYSWRFTPAAGNANPSTATGTKGITTWTQTSTNHEVKLKVSYCGIQDSITKKSTIVAPTQVPVADFIASENNLEIYDQVVLTDLSTNGAYIFSWEVTSPSGILYTGSGKTFTVLLDEVGKWDVCLTSENGIGPSAKKCKNDYIDVIPPTEYYIGPNKEANSNYGTLYDHNGPTGNYGNNRQKFNDYIKILPCGATEIRLKMKQIRLADAADKIRIYDASQEDFTKELTPSGGITSANQAAWRNKTFVSKSGALYITFESNSSGVDSGFIATWESDLAPPVAPIAAWTTPFDPAFTGVDVEFFNASKNIQGRADYEWIVDGYTVSNNENYSQIFYTTGQYPVCLAATTCNGSDTSCGTIDINTPTAPSQVDFKANNLRPKVGTTVDISVTTDYANSFEWSIFPTTFQYDGGTTKNSRNPKIRFNAGGCYTITLKAYNSIGGQSQTQKTVVKNKYICVLDYCQPLVDILSGDVGINSVKIEKGSSVLLNNESTSGTSAYTDYTTTLLSTVTYGASYNLTIGRRTNINPVNYKAWIDFNVDGDFDDAGEEIYASGSTNNASVTTTFTVPDYTKAFEGTARMRVGVSYGSFSNTSCGVNLVGEFEDYALKISNDNMPPMITLVGSDTIRVERGTSTTSCYQEVAGSTFTANDPTEGDLTSKVTYTSDLDCTIPGIYSFEFNLRDASGNPAPTMRRTVIVVLDRTAPVLTLNNPAPITIEQCDTYTEPGATAIDGVDGDLTSAIIITGSVNTAEVGDYDITYTVSDAQGNSVSATRTVMVRDTKKPGIFLVGNRITNGQTINIQINGVFVDQIYAEDVCNGSIIAPDFRKEPGFNGPVNTDARATYPVAYYAVDPNGNLADEDGFVINYRVDDYIAPEIVLNTEDVIFHDVNTAYTTKNVTVSDNYYPLNKVSVVKTGTVDPYVLGTYTETYTATDESGNVSTKVRTVIVVDRQSPTILAPAVNVCVGTPFWSSTGLILKDNYYSPAQLLPLVKVVNSNVNIWEAGVYYINYEVTDPSNNTSMMVTRPVFVNYPPNCQNTYLGAEGLELKDAVKIYPNPTTDGKFTLEYALSNVDPITVEVFTTTGSRVVALSNVKAGTGAELIDLSSYGAGIYQVRVTNRGQAATFNLSVVR